ncbi:MAG TPA: 50S ribosomal protein L29 [Planctomycetes bacterium]|jgi:large subunit ribosomal protein L29|nr:50S ribosomal protein L29 [Planctomycetota bacterium]
MKAKEVRGKEDAELTFDVEQLEKELHDMRFRSLVDGIQNPCRIRQIRREIGRIKTILNERKQGIRGQESR